MDSNGTKKTLAVPHTKALDVLLSVRAKYLLEGFKVPFLVWSPSGQSYDCVCLTESMTL